MLATPMDGVVTSCISFVSVQARKAQSFRCSSAPQKVLRLFGDPDNSLPFSLNVVPAPVFQQRSLARFRTESLGKIISHSDGHSVVIGKTKKPIHRDIKNRREFYSRFKMMFYVTALKFKDGTVCSSIHSLTVPKSIECRRRYFLLAYTQALVGLHRIPNPNILYSVLTLIQEGFYYIKTIAENQVFGKILYSFCKSRAYYFVTLSVERPIIGKYMSKQF